MNHKRTLLSLLLALALSLTACGKSAPAEEDVPQDDAPQVEEPALPDETVGGGETAAPDIRPAGPGVEATGTPAVTEGELVYTMDYDQGLLDGSGASGWFVSSWLAKGYGTRYYAVNPATGQVIQGEEGAPVILCGNGLIRFVWKDADGNEANADTVYFLMDEPQTYTLYAQIYGLDGQLREEREVLTWTQTAEDPYFTLVLPAMEQLVAELGGGHVEGQEVVLNVTDEGGDAVIHGRDGGALIRLPGVDASGIYAYASADGSYVSVYRTDSDQTEFYRF